METREKKASQNYWLSYGPPIALVLALAGGYYFWKSSHFETTDDAFIDGHIIPISSKVAGQVVSVFVSDNQLIKKGDVVVRIDPVPYEVKRLESKAKLDSAVAEAKRTSQEVARFREIYKKDEISQQQLDNAEAAASTALADVEREKASLEQAELNLEYTRIAASESGRVTKKGVEQGMYVQVGQSLLSLVPEELWITANFKETQLTRIRPGQLVSLKIDAYPDRELHGHVDSIQSGTGARFSLFPPENATGNFVKVVQRVPVKIVLDRSKEEDPFLGPGMSVDVSIRVRS